VYLDEKQIDVKIGVSHHSAIYEFTFENSLNSSISFYGARSAEVNGNTGLVFIILFIIYYLKVVRLIIVMEE
jgi:hypothetical protein